MAHLERTVAGSSSKSMMATVTVNMMAMCVETPMDQSCSGFAQSCDTDDGSLGILKVNKSRQGLATRFAEADRWHVIASAARARVALGCYPKPTRSDYWELTITSGTGDQYVVFTLCETLSFHFFVGQ